MNDLIEIKSDNSNLRIRGGEWPAVIAVLIAVTAIATLPFFFLGEDQKVGCCGGEMPVTHDSWMHFNQMRAFYRGLESGRIFPRWDDQTHGGYGAPTLGFYPPGAYYVTSLVYFLTRDWAKVWIGFYWLASLGSALAIYWYARQTTSRAASLVAAAVYVFAPYHLLNQYQRGAVAEFLSFVWAPLVALFAERLLSAEGARKNGSVWLSFAGAGLSFGAFLWSHPPTAYQFLLVFGPCFAVRAALRRRRRGLLLVGLALVFGSMLAAAYFYPAILEQKLVNYEDVEAIWPYHSSYVYDYSQKVYDQVGDPFFARLNRIWAFNAIAILLGSAGALRFGPRGRKGSAELRSRAWLWASAGAVACFFMTKYSEPIGRLIPKIEIGVFSWRMLALTSFVVAMLTGACVEVCGPAFRRGKFGAEALPPERGTTNSSRDVGFLPEVERRGISLPLAAALLILAATLAISVGAVARPMWRGQSFEPNTDHYNYATLPRGAPRETPPMEMAQLASGGGRVTIEEWRPESRALRVELGKPDRLQFRTSNFPGWTAAVDDSPVEIREGAVKNIVIDVPAGSHEVRLEHRPTLVRRVGGLVTALAVALLVSIVVAANRFRSAER